MLKFFVCGVIFLQITMAMHLDMEKRKITDKGDYVLICKHQPIDLGIVLDSSSSINSGDFQKGLTFLQNFLKEFSIGDGRNDVRVSVITFGKGIYPEDGFDLDTYHNYEEVKEAIGHIVHRAGLYTDTGPGIKYMHAVQMKKARPYAEQIGLVITDGNSQEWPVTARAAKAAREDGIKMFALGVGNVRDAELKRIAGDKKRIIKVQNYNELQNVTEKLAKLSCIRKNKPTTTPPPPIECGMRNQSDINFIFSPADLGLDVTYWATNFISFVVDSQDMQKGFRFGAVTGSCPEDEGFKLNAYTGPGKTEQIKDRLLEYERERLPGLVERTLEYGYKETSGGRPDAQDIAVLVIAEESQELIQDLVNRLRANGVIVYIADPYERGYQIEGAIVLNGPGARTSSTHFVDLICNQ